jgi:nucleoid-associated protein YgaU
MKRITFFMLTLSLCASAPLRAQDAATEERLNKLSGSIEDIRAAQETINKQLQSLSKEINTLREQASKPSPNYAAQDDLKRLADAIKEVDRKRQNDAELVRADLKKLATLVASGAGPKHPAGGTPSTDLDQTSAKAQIPDKNFEYEIKDGDTLSIIIQAYKQKNIKVSLDDILKANPGLNPNKLHPGQKILIPPPKGYKAEG